MHSARPAPCRSNPRLTEEPERTLSAPGRRDERPLPVVGRHPRLDLTFLYPNGRPLLAEADAEPPFRVGGWFAESGGLHVMLASSVPGAFGRDRLQQTVRVGGGARVRLTSQAPLQVHPSLDGVVAIIKGSYRVEAGAQVHCDWHPLIPFADSRLAAYRRKHRQKRLPAASTGATPFCAAGLHAKRHDEHVEVNRCPGLSIPRKPFPLKHQFPMAGFL